VKDGLQKTTEIHKNVFNCKQLNLWPQN